MDRFCKISKEALPLPDQIDEATKYIKKLKENVEDLKRIKESLVAINVGSNDNYKYNNSSKRSTSYSLNSPVQIEVNEKGSSLEVVLVTGLECQFVFTEAIRIIHEEHAQVVNASYSVVGSNVFHSIHALIGEDARSHGVARISERLKKFAL